MRIVADRNVVASALLWGGIPGQLLYAARRQAASRNTRFA